MCVVVVLSLFINDSKVKQFNFSILENNIDFVDIGYPNNTNVYKDIIDLFERDEEKESNIVNVQLSEKIKLEHLCNDIYSSNPYYFKTEYLKFYNDSISIDKLFSRIINEKKTRENVRIVFNKMIYQFSLVGKHYILIGASDRQFFRNIERNYWVLLEVDNELINNYYVFSDGYSLDANCFGDFNKDGRLDYLNWNFNQNHVALYSLDMNKFLKDKNKFFYVSPNVEEKESIERGIYVLYSNLNVKKSKWFYNLEK